MRRTRFALLLIGVALVAVLSLHRASMLVGKLDSGERSEVLLPISQPPLSTGDCTSVQTCLQCAALYNKRGCLWCAETSTCTSREASGLCNDVEAGYCSAILLRQLPGHFRIIYVGKRSGGPEALVQLHLALLHWGFNSTLETRVKQVGKGLLPFFRSVYHKEFEKYGVRMHRSRDYAAFLNSAAAADVLVLTETWPCKRSLVFSNALGARQLQYYLTAQDRKWTYDISHMYIPDAHPEACSIVAHTDFIANSYLNISRKAVLRPYVSPHIITRAESYQSTSHPTKKKSLILYDGDAGIEEKHFTPVFRSRLRKAASLKPEALYRLMENSVAVVDFNMPGAERLVLEASLFSCVVIINDELNGVSTVDFPVPSRFRISGRNYSQVEKLVDEIDRGDISALLNELNPFVAFVQRLKPEFLRSVRRYFSDSIHVIIRVDGGADSTLFGVDLEAQIIATLLFVPLATISVEFAGNMEIIEALAEFVRFRSLLEKHYLLSSVQFTSLGGSAVPASAAYVLAIVGSRWYFSSENVVGALAVECELGPCPYQVDVEGTLKFYSQDSWSGLGALPNRFDVVSWRSAGATMLVRTVSEVAQTQEAQISALWGNFCEEFSCPT